MGNKIFYVFQQESRRAFFCDNSCDIKKKSSLGGTFETMRTTKGVLFTYPSDREWLTRETCQQYIMIRYIFRFNFGNISLHLVILPEVLDVSFY